MSCIQSLRTEVVVAAPVEEVWSFFQTATNLVTMTPPEQKVRIGIPEKVAQERGDVCDYMLAK